MDRDLLNLIHDELLEGRFGVLCTVTGSEGSTPRDLGASMWVRPDGSIAGTIGGGILEYEVIKKATALLGARSGPAIHRARLREEESDGESVCGGDMIVLMEPLGVEAEVVIFGAGHVGKALAEAANAAGFSVTVWDEREDYANAGEIPFGRVITCPLGEVFERGLELDDRSYVVVATRGHSLDAEVLRLLEGKPMAYLGLMGSRKKIAHVRKSLMERGVSEEYLDRVFQPVGLPLRAETPGEIAASIISEIIAVHRGGDIETLRSPYAKGTGPFFPNGFSGNEGGGD